LVIKDFTLKMAVVSASRIWGKKNGKLLTSHRCDHLPLLPSGPGGFSRSWSYKTCRRKDNQNRTI